MARLADNMGITILNPELQITIENHHIAKALKVIDTSAQTSEMTNEPAQHEDKSQVSDAMVAQHISEQSQTVEALLRAKVLSIDPHAQFIIADNADDKRTYTGLVVAIINKNETRQLGFVQYIDRGVYALHLTNTPGDSNKGSSTLNMTTVKL